MSVALVIMHVTRMLRVALTSVACLSLEYFSTLSHNRHDFQENLLNIKCVFWFSLQLLSVTFFNSKKNWARFYHWYVFHVNHLLFLSGFMKLEFSRLFFFREIHKYQISWKSVQWEPSCSMRTDAQTDERAEELVTCKDVSLSLM